MAEYATKPSIEFPDQPILQFWTFHARLHLVYRDENQEKSRLSERGLARYDVVDGIGDWCGSLLLHQRWKRNIFDTEQYDFIAISDAKEFTEVECPTWTYYIPKERD